ncbi:hypothetical protein WJX81_007661 [Elliptochloris bilobata]|uniref:Fungal lipase-type domain-containing protein n=1 Tax=Elliptochloris bilobata TaxID=381761 RepID=A0AAW1QKI3_9CHLO
MSKAGTHKRWWLLKVSTKVGTSQGVRDDGKQLLPFFPILFIPNEILLWMDWLTKELLSPIYGYPSVKGARYSCVNLGFGTHEWKFPASTAHTFLGLPRQSSWSPHAARVLSMMSKIVYEEFLDAEVCQALLDELPLVKAELVAGFQFTRIDYHGQPPGGEDLQSLEVAIIKMSKPQDPSQTAVIVAFRGSEPFIQADWFMDFNFILSPRGKGDPPAVGNVHQGFRFGLGLDVNLNDLPGVVTYCRYVTNFGTPKKHRTIEKRNASAFSIIADALAKVPEVPVWVTGHSLGGGMAHLFAVALALRSPHGLGKRLATLYTFAQPRIGDRKFVHESNRLLHKKHYRLANAIDIVPRVPPTKWTWLPFSPWEWLEKPLTPLPVDHTIDDGDAEPPLTTIPRWLYFGMGKLAWGTVCCLLLPPLRGVYAFAGYKPPMWAQAPCETLLRLMFRVLPPVWAISDHFIGAYCNMYWSPVS